MEDIFSAASAITGNLAKSMILTERCGHQRNVDIPSETLDILEKKLDQFEKEQKSKKHELKAEVLDVHNLESQLLDARLSSCAAGLILSSEQGATTKDSGSWEPTFETVKAFLMSEVEAQKNIFFLKHAQLSELKKANEKLLRQIEQEEILVKSFMSKEEEEEELQSEKENLERREKELRTLAYKRRQELCNVIEKYFPTPNEKEVKKAVRALKITQFKPKSMKRIINILYEQLSKNREEDPSQQWVTADHTFWYPFVTFLVESGIAESHPEDSNRIRLVDFGKTDF